MPPSIEVSVAVFLPKGTRDFLPQEMTQRLQVIETIRGVFHQFGFDPLETPAIERIETLTGKYGDETDKLMFRIHKRGRDVTPGECDLALRYDLTVPLARVLAMHGELRMPFKRYQIQPVWRAERPQKGRFREFYQCDVDIAGTVSPMADAECIAVADAALRALGFSGYAIQVNDRRILGCFARRSGATDIAGELQVLIALDKLDKIGRDKVLAEIAGRGFDPAGLDALWSAMDTSGGSRDSLLNALEADLDEEGRAGIETLRQVIELAVSMGVAPDTIRFDPSLARGADYYTGPVFEVSVEEPRIGSVAGGGRYDNLVESLSGRAVPAVGVSLGLERLLVVMDELGMLDARPTSADVLVTVFSEETRWDSARAAASLREQGVSAELYVGDGRMKAQLKHANKRGYPWVLVVGPDEAAAGLVTLKNNRSWESTTIPVLEVAQRIREDGGSLDPDPGTR
ncbi:MAG: histidine--tRNA ligase [Myxococcota bacterium]